MVERMLAGVVLGLVLLLALDAVAARAGVATGALPTIAGPSAWTMSRAAGVTAYVALTAELVFGLFVSTRVADRWLARARSVDVHQWLSSVVLALVAVHAFVLLLDGYVRFDVLDVLVPGITSYRPLAVSLGALAAYAGLVVHVSFWLRRSLGNIAWRRLHYLSFGVFAAATAHGVLAGSDSGLAWLPSMYWGACLLVGGLVVLRVLTARSLRASPRRS